MVGVLTGVFAYLLWEREPRNAHERGPGMTLYDLVSRRLGVTSHAEGEDSASELADAVGKAVGWTPRTPSAERPEAATADKKRLI